MTNDPAYNRGSSTSTSMIVSPRQSATGAILPATNTTVVKPVALSSARRVTIGTDAERALPITLADNEREGGFYVLGQPRTGKSTLLASMALQDIENGHGLLFIDPHYDAINQLLARIPNRRIQDVILLDPSDNTRSFALNVLHCAEIGSSPTS